MEAFLAELRIQESLITEFDERLWYVLVDSVTVHGVEDVRFLLKNDTENRG